MASLAGRPPFSTDDKGIIYEAPQPTRRLRQPPPSDPDKRTPPYDVYDPNTNRRSGVDAVGMGFLTGSMDDDDDDDNLDQKISMPTPQHVGSKHAALAAAVALPKEKEKEKEFSPPQKEPTPPPQYIASPRPGYAAPISALNLARPEPAAVPGGRQPNLRINPVSFSPNTGFSSPSPSISVPSTPHPLQPPMTPITPVFAQPHGNGGVKFAVPREKAIMRSNSEDFLIPKRGDAGDDFWRRFSMVAKEENRKPPGKKQSAWLSKTQSQTSVMSRWVLLIGVVLLIAAAGGIGIWWYISHKSSSNTAPTAIGGSAQESAISSISQASTTVGSATVSVRTSLHVTPTNTVARRTADPIITNVPREHRRWSHAHHGVF